MQSVDICLQTATELLNSTKAFLVELRTNEKFILFVQKAKLIAASLGVSNDFPADSTRIRRKKMHFSYEGADEPILDPTEKFKIEFYFKILDQAISSISERFEQIREHNNIFLFLYNIASFKKDPSLITKFNCINWEKKLEHNGVSDVSGDELYEEIKMLSTLLESQSSLKSVLEFIYNKHLETLFPNLVISIKIALVLPVSVASGERTFSKLKLIKNYCRTTMSQERLVGLATISIEKELAETLDYEEIIENFAKAKARRVNFT